MKGIIRPKSKGRLDPTQVWRRLLPWRYVSNRLFELPFSQPQRMWGTEYKAQSSLSIESLLGDPPPSLETTEVYPVHERLKQKYTLPCQSSSTPWESPSVVSDCLRPLGLYSPWNSSGQNIRVGSIPFSFPPFPFSSGSSQPRDRTQVSHIAGGFFISWTTREAHQGAIREALHEDLNKKPISTEQSRSG